MMKHFVIGILVALLGFFVTMALGDGEAIHLFLVAVIASCTSIIVSEIRQLRKDRDQG